MGFVLKVSIINDYRKIPSKQEKIINQYWQKIDEINSNIPQDIKLDRYQSHRMKIVAMAKSSCSKIGYFR